MGEHVIMERVSVSRTRGKALGVACALALLAGTAVPAGAARELAATEQGIVHVGSVGSDAERVRTLDVELGKTTFFHTDFAARRSTTAGSSTASSRCSAPPA